MKPIVEKHQGVFVIRDDLFPGGTKARYVGRLFDDADEVVYASPAEGGGQFALAYVAHALGKKATIFVAKRQTPHPRWHQAKALGASVVMVTPGYLTVVQARARAYAAKRGAKLAPFGMAVTGAEEAIAAAAYDTGCVPDRVLCAAGSGVLARGLAMAWPNADRHVVQVGRKLEPKEVAGATIHIASEPFARTSKTNPPFPADPHYEAKAWRFAQSLGEGVVFWNVAGPATIAGA